MVAELSQEEKDAAFKKLSNFFVVFVFLVAVGAYFLLFPSQNVVGIQGEYGEGTRPEGVAVPSGGPQMVLEAAFRPSSRRDFSAYNLSLPAGYVTVSRSTSFGGAERAESIKLTNLGSEPVELSLLAFIPKQVAGSAKDVRVEGVDSIEVISDDPVLLLSIIIDAGSEDTAKASLPASTSMAGVVIVAYQSGVLTPDEEQQVIDFLQERVAGRALPLESAQKLGEALSVALADYDGANGFENLKSELERVVSSFEKEVPEEKEGESAETKAGEPTETVGSSSEAPALFSLVSSEKPIALWYLPIITIDASRFSKGGAVVGVPGVVLAPEPSSEGESVGGRIQYKLEGELVDYSHSVRVVSDVHGQAYYEVSVDFRDRLKLVNEKPSLDRVSGVFVAGVVGLGGATPVTETRIPLAAKFIHGEPSAFVSFLDMPDYSVVANSHNVPWQVSGCEAALPATSAVVVRDEACRKVLAAYFSLGAGRSHDSSMSGRLVFSCGSLRDFKELALLESLSLIENGEFAHRLFASPVDGKTDYEQLFGVKTKKFVFVAEVRSYADFDGCDPSYADALKEAKTTGVLALEVTVPLLVPLDATGAEVFQSVEIKPINLKGLRGVE